MDGVSVAMEPLISMSPASPSKSSVASATSPQRRVSFTTTDANSGSPDSVPSTRYRSYTADISVGLRPNTTSEKQAYPLPPSIYGLVVFTFAWEGLTDRIYPCNLRRFVALMLFSIGLVLQIGTCLIILAGPIRVDEQQYMQLFAQNVTGKLTEAIAANRALHGTPLENVCANEHASVRGIIQIYYFVMVVWICRMLQELSELVWLIVAILNVPEPEAGLPGSRPSNDAACRDLEDINQDGLCDPAYDTPTKVDAAWAGEEIHITGLRLRTRLLMLGTVGLVRFLTYFLVQWAGINFLVLSTSTISMIIKCLALQWIVAMPELLFSAAASNKVRERMKKASLYIDQCNGRAMQLWDEGFSSIVRVLWVCLVTCVVFSVSRSGFFLEIMLFRYECQRYARHFPTSGADGRGWEFLAQYLLNG